MRKWIAFMVALAIAACIGCALAENIDLSGLSDDELLTLENRIQAEIVAPVSYTHLENPFHRRRAVRGFQCIARMRADRQSRRPAVRARRIESRAD